MPGKGAGSEKPKFTADPWHRDSLQQSEKQNKKLKQTLNSEKERIWFPELPQY